MNNHPLFNSKMRHLHGINTLYQVRLVLFVIAAMIWDFAISAQTPQSPEMGSPAYTLFEAEVIGAGHGISSLGQDRLGRLLVTSGHSLLAYDGNNWTKYWQEVEEEGFEHTLLRTVVGPDQNLYASTDRGIFKVNYLSDNRFELIALSLDESLHPDNFYSLYNVFILNDSIYFYGASRVAQYTPVTGKLNLLRKGGLDISHVRTDGDTIVIYRFDGGVSRLDEQGHWNTSFPNKTEEYGKMIQSSSDWGESGQILGSISTGMYSSSGEKISEWKTEDFEITNPGVLDIEVFKNDYLAVSIQSFGIVLLDRNKQVAQLLSRQQDFRLGSATELLYAGGNVLWARFELGVARIRFMDPLTNYAALSPVAMVLPISFRHNDNLHIRTNRTILKADFFKGGALKGYTTLRTEEGESINDCISTPDGIMYGTDSGVFLLHENGDNERLLKSDTVTSRLLHSEINPSIVICTSERTHSILEYKNGNWNYNGVNTPSSGYVYERMSDGHGRFWVEHGVGKVARISYQNGELINEIFTTKNGLTENWINLWKAGNNIYFSSGEARNFKRWDGETQQLVPAVAMLKLIGSRFSGVARPTVTGKGDIWIPLDSNHPILRLQSDGSYDTDRDTLKPLAHKPLLQIFPGRDGVMWMRGRRDLYSYDESYRHAPATLPQTSVYQIELLNQHAVLYDKRQAKQSSTLDLPYTNNSLRFNFASVNQAFTSGIIHQTYLEGFSNEWSTTHSGNTVSYPNLKEGQYTLRLRSTPDGVNFGQESSIAFNIQPPLYRTKLAYVGYILAAVLALAILRFRAGKKNRQLQALVDERTEELNLANNNLTNLFEEADAASKAKSAFLATVSHEMRTPLNAVIGPADLLLASDPNELQKKFLHMIKTAGMNLLDFIDDVLAFTSNNTKEKPINYTKFDLRKLIVELTDSFAIKALDKELAIQRQFDADVSDMWIGDPKLIRQVISNLLNNAIKYTETGQITLTVLSAINSNSKNTLTISVEDTGIGIPAKARDVIFNPFQQVDNSITRQYDGAGLGLAICKQLVERLGGEIDFKSSLGEGSKFWFSIPMESLSELEQVIPASNENSNSQTLNQKRILLVDDNEANREIASYILNQMHCQVETAPNGKEAVNKAANAKFDLILMDLRMPQMNGIEASRLIRKNENENTKTPIIALSAFLSESMKNECEEAGIDRYISKPITPEQLTEAVADTIKAAS